MHTHECTVIHHKRLFIQARRDSLNWFTISMCIACLWPKYLVYNIIPYRKPLFVLVHFIFQVMRMNLSRWRYVDRSGVFIVYYTCICTCNGKMFCRKINMEFFLLCSNFIGKYSTFHACACDSVCQIGKHFS